MSLLFLLDNLHLQVSTKLNIPQNIRYEWTNWKRGYRNKDFAGARSDGLATGDLVLMPKKICLFGEEQTSQASHPKDKVHQKIARTHPAIPLPAHDSWTQPQIGNPSPCPSKALRNPTGLDHLPGWDKVGKRPNRIRNLGNVPKSAA